ncbi:MAG: heme biosynthesis HemY N-terminal domain-containing protein, partial [Pseudomonadota bacterium]
MSMGALNLPLKILAWVLLAAAGGMLLHQFIALEGLARIEFLGAEYSMKTSVFLALMVAVFAAFWVAMYLFVSGVRGIAGVFDIFRRSRHRSGLKALSQAMVAIEEGDGRKAMASAAKAERMLDNPDLTRLVNAKAAAVAGAQLRAERYYEAMALDDDTEFLGVRGLLRRALDEKKPERALKLAERAHALRPRDADTLDLLFTLQRKKGDWPGARNTIDGMARAGRLTRDVADRRKAVLLLTDAKAKENAGDTEGATRDAQSAAKLAPGLAPAAAMSARLAMEKGERRSAGRTLLTAWRQDPHPEVAEAYAALVPDETPEGRLKRFEKLFAANPRAVETKLLEAELGIAAGKLVQAREAVDAALTAGSSARAYALMAAIASSDGVTDASSAVVASAIRASS